MLFPFQSSGHRKSASVSAHEPSPTTELLSSVRVETPSSSGSSHAPTWDASVERPRTSLVDGRLDETVAHLELAVRSAEAALDHARFALCSARRLRATRRSQAASRLVDHALDTRLHLTSALAQIDEAVPTPPAPPRTRQPQSSVAALTYTPPASADAA